MVVVVSLRRRRKRRSLRFLLRYRAWEERVAGGKKHGFGQNAHRDRPSADREK